MEDKVVTLAEVMMHLRGPCEFAHLDWFSGVTRLNLGKEHYDRIKRLEPSESNVDEMFIDRTLAHERYHYLQVAFCGYLYKVACEMVRDAGELLGQGMTSLRNLRSRVSTSLAESVRKRIEALDVSGVDGLTTRSLVESSALLFELQLADANLSYQDYFAELYRNAPGGMYRQPVDFVFQQLGDAGFRRFHLICNLALCSSNPVGFFVALTEEIAQRELQTAQNEELLRLANSLDCGFEFIGTALEVRHRFDLTHPEYDRMHQAILELQNPRLSLLSLMSDPVSYVECIADVGGLCVLNPSGPEWPMMRVGCDQPNEAETQFMLLTGAICSILLDAAFDGHNPQYYPSTRAQRDRGRALDFWRESGRDSGMCDRGGESLTREDECYLVKGPNTVLRNRGDAPTVIKGGNYLLCPFCYSQMFWQEAD